MGTFVGKLGKLRHIRKIFANLGNFLRNYESSLGINSQSLEDTQVGYISQKYTLDQYTLEEYTLEVVQKYIYIFERSSLHIHFRAVKPSYTF